jgi:MoaA/NifB/PqqE/SkfB family radical SAM enzyme
MYRYEDIKEVHLEITEKCQAACPMCPRNMNGGAVNPLLTMAELTLEDCKKIFEPDFIKQLKTMYMCGNFGDAIIAKDTLEVFEYFRKCNSDLLLGMHTNAGARKEEWWKELAKILGTKGYVIFSVDGLEDTNHIYRQNVNWDIVIRSMEAFINAGGKAKWAFIVFEHNEHQIEEARAFSKKLGFKKFQIKKSDRFWNPKTHSRAATKETLEMPTAKKYQNQVLYQKEQIEKQYGSMETYYDQTKIKCKVVENNSVYISAEGLCLPCCWTGVRMYRGFRKSESIWNFIDAVGGKKGIDAINNRLEDVINNSRFFTDIKRSWSCSNTQHRVDTNNPGKEGKLDVCAQKCGEKFDTFKEMFGG